MNKQELVVADDMIVRIEYTLTLDDGEIYATSAEDGPLDFLQGSGEIVLGLEEALYGLSIGQSKEVVVTPAYGYGEYALDGQEVLPLELFPAEMELEPGTMIGLYDEESDEEVDAYVVAIRSDGVLVDLNHPLAGQTLHFLIKVLGVRPATSDELEHGHVHADE